MQRENYGQVVEEEAVKINLAPKFYVLIYTLKDSIAKSLANDG
jgi:hypothetical protein